MADIYYNKQYINTADKKAVYDALNENLITGGKKVKIFEDKLKKFLNVKYVKTCINGTAGLHMAYEAINLKKNDVIVMPIINFIAAYNMATLYQAKIYFADVNSLTGQMTTDTLLECIKKNKIKKIRAVVTMYMGGYPENVKKFYELKKKYNFLLIEDACHAFGASYNKVKVGSCKHSDLCVFSFHPVKSITTGEGGAITTNNKNFFNRFNKFGSHNIDRNFKYWDYDIKKLGFNYRLSDLNCALGISQLNKIGFFIKQRSKIYSIYQKSFQNLSAVITLPKYNFLNKASYHLFIVKINFKYLKSSKDELINFLNSKKIYPQFHYKPITEFNFFKKKII